MRRRQAWPRKEFCGAVVITFGGGSNGNGTIFKITTLGRYSQLYSFGPSSGATALTR